MVDLGLGVCGHVFIVCGLGDGAKMETTNLAGGDDKLNSCWVKKNNHFRRVAESATELLAQGTDHQSDDSHSNFPWGENYLLFHLLKEFWRKVDGCW